MTHRRVPFVAVVLLAASCTTGESMPTPPPPSSPGPSGEACPSFVLRRNDGSCVDTFDLDGATYRVACISVPEVLLDVAVPVRWGRAAVRAIAAVPTTQALAVTGTGDACGEHPVALRTDLSEATASAIVAELERAASLPPDLEKEPAPAEAPG